MIVRETTITGPTGRAIFALDSEGRYSVTSFNTDGVMINRFDFGRSRKSAWQHAGVATGLLRAPRCTGCGKGGRVGRPLLHGRHGLAHDGCDI